MQKQPLVSIVTPAYNQAEYLAETIESVLAQDYPAIEYIVVDDGSSDHTPEILQRYRGQIITRRQSNMGQARTLNKAWHAAGGKYLGYLSSDDILYPTAVQKLVDALERDNSLICAYPDCDLIDERSRLAKRNVCRPFDLVELVIQQECYIGPGALFRASGFRCAGGWDPELKLAPDREFWIRLAEFGAFYFHEESLAGYRMHRQAISYKDISEEAGREYISVLDRYFRKHTVPSEIAARKAEAYGHAHLTLARNAFRAGRIRRGFQLYEEACRFHPPLANSLIKMRILRNVVSKPLRLALSAARSAFKG